MNKLAQKTVKSDKPAKKAKAASAPTPVMDAVPTPYKERKIAGLPEGRYYEAKSALDSLARAEEIKQNSKLQQDVQKVARHEMNRLSAVTGMKKA